MSNRIELDKIVNGDSLPEKTNFAIHLVCEKRLLNEIIKTKLMTYPEVKYIVDKITNGNSGVIPRNRRVKIETAEHCNDTFVVTKNLAESLDYIEYGVHEGFGKK